MNKREMKDVPRWDLVVGAVLFADSVVEATND
jgi:hypothetical protein